MTRYAVLIDYHTEGLQYVMRHDPGMPLSGPGVVHEVDTIGEALVVAADHAHGHNWEIVRRIDVRTTAGSRAAQLGLVGS